MTLAQLRDAVRVRLGVAPNDSFYGTSTLNDLINESVAAIGSEADWPWLTVSTSFATVSGTAAYTPPADWVSTKQLIIDSYDPIVLRSITDVRSWPSTDRGVPAMYTIFDDDLILRPVPDGVYTVIHDYIRTEPLLTQDSDSPRIPSQFHHAIVQMAAALSFERSGDMKRHEAAMMGYGRWLNRLKDHSRRSRQSLKVRVRPGREF